MAELNVSLILKLVDRATGPARAAMRALDRVGGDGMMRQAEKISRGSRMMADGAAQAGRSALAAGAAVATYAGLLTAIGVAFVRPAAQFENFNVQLTNLEGSAEGAKKAMSWIEDFATRTPLELEDTVAAYAKLRAFGIDPTNGSLQAIVDTMAASGGGAEQLDGIVLALGQAWTKQKLQGEEAMQLLERGVPVWDLLAEKTGKSAAELMEMASAGKLGREEIMLLIEAMAERNAGASDAMSKTWDGIISNLMDYWTKFQRLVMDAGLFDFMKGNLQDLLSFLNAAAADGRLQAWAEATSKAVLTAMQALYAFGVWSYETWTAVWPVLDQVAQSIGGWDVVGWAAGFLLFKGTILGVVGGLWTFSAGLLLVGQGFFGIGGEAARAASRLTRIGHYLGVGLTAAAQGAGKAITWLGRAFLIAGRFMLANPIIAVIAAIAGLAYVIYQNWDGIVAYFSEKIDAVRAAFDEGLLNGVLELLSEFNPFVLIMDAAEGLFTYLTGWTFEDVTASLSSAFDIDLVDKGIQMIVSLWDGMKAKMGEMTAWFSEQVSGMLPDWMRSDMGPAGVDVGNTGSSTTGEDFNFGGEPSAPTGGEPHKELGGGVRRGQTYMVGERGRELFTPDRDGWIIPNRKLAGAARGGAGGGSVQVGQITIHAAPGMSPEMIARAVRAEMERAAKESRFALNDGASYA